MKTNEPGRWLACLAGLGFLLNLTAEETALVKEGHVNVRGQPSLVGEVITQLQKGEKVVVLEEVAVAKPKTNEPAKWIRIQMPANTPVWVATSCIDPASKTVKVSRLNLRAGPGENYSVIGRLQRGAPVSEIRRVEDWMEIETPPGAFAFVAADLLTKPEPGASPVAATPEASKIAPVVTPPPEIPKTESTVAPAPAQSRTAEAPTSASRAPEIAPVVTLPPEIPKTESTVAPAPAQSRTAAAPTNTSRPPEAAPAAKAEPIVPTATPVATATGETQVQATPRPTAPPPQTAKTTPAPVTNPKAEETLVRRVVRREGIVRSTTSIQAPTYYELLNPDNRKTINYLHMDQLGVNLKDYRGRRIIVTGEEAIDPRWPKTPVIEVESLELIP